MILTKFLHNGRELWSSSLLTSKEWCLYIRFLYDHILRRKRYSYQNRFNQITDFMNSKKDKVSEGFLNFGVSLLDGIQIISHESFIYEPLFQKFVYPFIQNAEEQAKLELPQNLLLLLESKFEMSEFSVNDQEKRTECGPCLDMYEMLHFLFLMGYSNIGLKYFRDNSLNPGQRTGNTTSLVSTLINSLLENSGTKESFLTSMDFFLEVLADGFQMKSDEMYQNLNLFLGKNDEEKRVNRQLAIVNLFIYYSQMQEQLVIASQLNGNPDLEQFFIKGGIMLCTYGVKEYLIGDVAVVVSDNEAVNEVATMAATKVVGKGIDSALEAINLPEIVASNEQKIHGSSKGNILENLIGGIAGQVLPSFYIQIDIAFLNAIKKNQDLISVTFSRIRLLI